MSYIQNPRHYTVDEFAVLVETLKWDKGWRPLFPTLHNTGVPSLVQWIGYGATAQERWGANLNRYYKGLGWHAGPHLVCCPDYIWVLCDPEADGVSVSCWNRFTFGIEMVGDYRKGGDDPINGEGARVIENAVQALAILSRKLKWDLSVIKTGLTGLHFHRECLRDGHLCPGDLIDKASIVTRVGDVLKKLGTPTVAAPATSVPAVTTPAPLTSLARRQYIQSRLNLFGNAGLTVDGVIGDATEQAMYDFLQEYSKNP